MSPSLDQRYFDWLYCQVVPELESESYRELFYILFTKEVVFLVPNDDNRLEDGKELRREFLGYEGYSLEARDWLWMDLGCSFLEFLIGIARRAAFMTNTDQEHWFWEMLMNINLAEFNDQKINKDEVLEILDRVIWRTYDYDGTGGLFPLDAPGEDQREVEIWYQLSAYILERSYI